MYKKSRCSETLVIPSNQRLEAVVFGFSVIVEQWLVGTTNAHAQAVIYVNLVLWTSPCV